MIELRWLTRVIVGSEFDPADEEHFQVLQYRNGQGKWADVPHKPQPERVPRYRSNAAGD